MTKPNRVTVSFRIPPEHREALEAEAELYQTKWTERARLAIAEHIVRQKIALTIADITKPAKRGLGAGD